MCFPLIELGHRAAPPLRFASYRSFIAGATLITPLIFFDWKSLFNSQLWKCSIWVALTYTVLGLGGMFLADSRVAPGVSTVLANTQPFIAVILAHFFLNEKINKAIIYGLATCFLGILLIALENYSSSKPFSGSLIGIIFILLGAAGTGAGNTLMKYFSKSLDPIRLVGIQFLLASVILYTLSHTFEGHLPTNWHPSFTWSLLILAIPGTAITTVAWFYLLKKIELSRLVIYSFLTPVFGILIGIFFFKESISALKATGIMLTLAGTFFISFKRSSAKSGARPRKANN